MKARRVKKLDPSEPLADNAARIVRVRLDEMRSFAPRAWSPALPARSTTCGSPRSGCATCSRRPSSASDGRPRRRADAPATSRTCSASFTTATSCCRVSKRHLAGLRKADADAVRMWAGEASDLDPALAAHAPHRTSYRGLEMLIVYLLARRALLFDRFQSIVGRAGARGHLGARWIAR